MTKIIFILLLLFIYPASAVILEDYLPQDSRYDTSIPTPKAVTGVEVGERHYRHDQIIHYLSVIAAASPRAKLVDYGLTNEGRRLVLLFISKPENISRLDSLPEDTNLLKVWNGFSVHGNEASGANAAVLYAYYLIAGHSDEINNILKDSLIIIDPTINPDGYDRFVTDVNSFRGIIDSTDEHDMSHNEQSPSGRTNHYWFDLNRDWLLLSQTESRYRIKQFHKWQPHVLDDHHEMGSNRTFFFQPGVPERTNPLIPDQNINLTNALGQFHAKTLDEKKASYYSKESYDDFFPGKGSTYPDLHGSVGILFEQAGAKAGKLKTSEGMRLLSDGIDNHFRTAVSTLKGAYALKQELTDYKKSFYENALKAASKEGFNGYLVDYGQDIYKTMKLAEFLNTHQITFEKPQKDMTLNNHKFKADNSIFIPLQQKQYTLIKSLFMTDKEFKDNTFYDISAWNLPMAWGLNYAKVKSKPETENIQWKQPHNSYRKNAVAYAFNWDNGNTAGALSYLLQRDIKVKVLAKSFKVKTNGNVSEFRPGSIIIPVTESNEKSLITDLSNLAEFFQVSVSPLSSGFTSEGVDLGSPSITTLKAPNILMLTGDGVNPYQAGSIWHLFDTQAGQALTKINIQQLKNININDYTHFILPSADLGTLTDTEINKIINWVKNGGSLISFQKSAKWVESKIQSIKSEEEKEETDIPERKAYSDFKNDEAQRLIGGAIITANADLSHPLAFGMHQQEQYIMMQGSNILSPSDNPYSTPLIANNEALAAGYISNEKLKEVNSSSLLISEKLGKGNVIKFAFNPNFRGYWLGTQKWLINSVYFSSLIKKTLLPK